VDVPAPPANEDLVIISCKTSEAAAKADWSNPEPSAGFIIAIRWGMKPVISLVWNIKLQIEETV
jgi:hypothetical protein